MSNDNYQTLHGFVDGGGGLCGGCGHTIAHPSHGKDIPAPAESTPAPQAEPWRKAGVLFTNPPDMCEVCDSKEFISAGPNHLECYRCSLERESDWLRTELKKSKDEYVSLREELNTAKLNLSATVEEWNRLVAAIGAEKDASAVVQGKKLKARAEEAESRLAEVIAERDELKADLLKTATTVDAFVKRLTGKSAIEIYESIRGRG